jgi:adenosylcobyric acid synthase
VFASLYGTLALLEPADQALVSGFVINKFRGQQSLLLPGLTQLTALTGRPVLGVVPYLTRTWIDAEDAVATEGSYGPENADDSDERLRIAVIRLPRISNFTDADALALEPGVSVRFVSSPAGLDDAHLVILPGTKATVADLAWLRARGLDAALAKRAADGRPVLGICGGYQMLGTVIHDEIESRAGTVCGLGLLPVETSFATAKTLRRPCGYAGSAPVAGYEIHHGTIEVHGGRPWFTSRPDDDSTALDGCRAGVVSGTLWHGIFENDGFRQSYLAEIARLAGWAFVPAAGTSFTAARQAQFDALADAVASSLDTSQLVRLIEHGPAAGLPALRPGHE